MWSQGVVRGSVVGVVTVLIAGSMSVAVAGAQSVETGSLQSKSLIYATYKGEGTAGQVFKTMKSAQGATGERIESYAIVSKDLKGKVQVRDQRRTDAGVGAVVGAVIGLWGGPIGMALGAEAGGVTGYLAGDAVGIPRDKVESMKQALTPGNSALVVLLDDRWVQDLEVDMRQAHARQVIATQLGME
jgi:uncharacterized membrane protein